MQHLISLVVLVAACTSKEQVGVATFVIDNPTADALDVSFTPGPVVEPSQLVTTIAAGATVPAFESGGCFGCADEPADVLATLTLTPPAGPAIVFDPVDNADWSRTNGAGGYDAVYTLVVADPR